MALTLTLNMLSLRSVAALLLVAALAHQASAAPQPWSVKGAIHKAADKVSGFFSPTLDCLKAAGLGDAAFVWLRDCGQTARFGKFAIGSCAATANAPHEVKEMVKSSANCFNLEG